MRGMLAYDATDGLASLVVPALVVTGDRDPQTTPEAHVTMADRTPSARLLRLSPARHQGHFERHAEFTAAVTEFLTHGAPAAPPRPAAVT